jgi:hypothetical protein
VAYGITIAADQLLLVGTFGFSVTKFAAIKTWNLWGFVELVEWFRMKN